MKISCLRPNFVYPFFPFCLVPILALNPPDTLEHDDSCTPVVQDGKEVPQKAAYRVDDKRSFGKPGSASHPVHKKHCEMGKYVFSLSVMGLSHIQYTPGPVRRVKTDILGIFGPVSGRLP